MIALIIQLLMLITPAISAATIALKLDELKRAGVSKQWPAAQANITEVRIVPTGKKYQGQPLYRPEVALSYRVDGMAYNIIQQPVDAKGLADGPKQWAREVTLNYKPDTAVRLYYNPQRPKQATLQPGQATVDKGKWMIIGSVMLVFSFILCVLSILAITHKYMNVTTTISMMLGIVAFIIMLMLGVLISLLAQEMRAQKT